MESHNLKCEYVESLRKEGSNKNDKNRAVGIFHKGRMAFSIESFKPRKHTEADCTTYFLQKGNYIEDLGEYILIRRDTHDYMFVFRA